jgi:hypothetical protein
LPIDSQLTLQGEIMATRVSGSPVQTVYSPQFTSELEALEKLTAQHQAERPSAEALEELAKRVNALASTLRVEEEEYGYHVDDVHASSDTTTTDDFVEVQGRDNITARVGELRSWIETRQKEAEDRQFHLSGTWLALEKKASVPPSTPPTVLIQAPPPQAPPPPLPQNLTLGQCYTEVFKCFAPNLSYDERRNQINARLALLQPELRGSLYLYVWESGGKQKEAQWAKDHIGDHQGRLEEAFKRLLAVKIGRLTFHLRQGVYAAVYQAAGSPQTTDRSWGEHHAFDDIPRLCAAMERLQHLPASGSSS